MHEIGRIKQVQIQRSPLKIGQKPQRYYDPSPLLIVNSLLLSTRGVIGVTAEGEEVIDVHHTDHPSSRNQSVNAVSMGFTSHYQSMRTQFGPHLPDGCAGENILVETAEEQKLARLADGIAIQSAKTGLMMHLTDIMVAAPCVEFSQFAACDIMPLVGERLKEALQFLDHGKRGFYMTLAPQQKPVAIQAGDLVFAL
ncbi:MAG TPA: hypothetical protein VFB60_14515 [Ktedonobacteraceae bacterium]|nr:hypothetical protein [Ktedonobacteraceae bacterium]